MWRLWRDPEAPEVYRPPGALRPRDSLGRSSVSDTTAPSRSMSARVGADGMPRLRAPRPPAAGGIPRGTRWELVAQDRGRRLPAGWPDRGRRR